MSDHAAGAAGPPKHGVGGPRSGAVNPFGAALGPALVRACENRLTDIHWFRADWQRGGALTGHAKYNGEGGQIDVVVKLPIPPQELHWLRRLQEDRHDAGDVVPRLYASGESMNGYDLAWAVMERLAHGPLDSTWQGAEWQLIVETMGRFYAAAEKIAVDRPAREEDWPALLRKARHNIREHQVLEEQRWNTALKQIQKRLKKLLKIWDARDVKHWCHGDVHLANAMTRSAPPAGPALIFDLAQVHAGHWVEDAVYLEHLYWGHEARFGGRELVKMIAHERKVHGLKLEANWPILADIRRALVAATAPAYLHAEGRPKHVHAALGVLERMLNILH